MRVCLLTRQYPPDTESGEMATFTEHLAHGLIELGHEVEVIAPVNQGASGSQVQEGIPVHRVANTAITCGGRFLPAYIPHSAYVIGTAAAMGEKLLQLHETKPFDVVDAPDFLGAGLMPALTKVMPLVVRLYTSQNKSVSPDSVFDDQLVSLLERLAITSADATVSSSEELCRLQKNITLVGTPVDASKFSPRDTASAANSGTKTVLYVGRLDEQAGAGYLIDAIPKVIRVHPDVQFVLACLSGDGANQRKYLAELRESLAVYKCEDRVSFLQNVPESDLPSCYRNADICVIPSVYASSPQLCLQAMSSAVATVATATGITRQYLINGESGRVIRPRDSEEIADALLALLSDSEERQRLGDNARKRVLENFQRSEIARQTIDLYQEARQRHLKKREHATYLKEERQLLSDTELLLGSFEKMLYDELYRQSYRFRIKHWIGRLRSEPQLRNLKMLFNSFKMRLQSCSPRKAP